jgi:CrcB protein
VDKTLWVALGGALGSVLRFGVGTAVHRWKGASTFPWETMTVNVLCCLVAGVLMGLVESRGWFGEATRAFLFVGLLGGFTTFSAFGNDTFQLLRGGHAGAAMFSVAGQLVLGIGAVFAGYVVTMAMTGGVAGPHA